MVNNTVQRKSTLESHSACPVCDPHLCVLRTRQKALAEVKWSQKKSGCVSAQLPQWHLGVSSSPIPHSLTLGCTYRKLMLLGGLVLCWVIFRRCQRPLRTNWVLRRPGLSSWPQEVLPVGVTLDELFTLSILQFSSLAKGVPSGWVNMRKLLGAMPPTW